MRTNGASALLGLFSITTFTSDKHQFSRAGLIVVKVDSSRSDNSENSSRHENNTEILGNMMLSRDFSENLSFFFYILTLAH